MKVLVVEPMKECYTKEINGLEEMQALVGGYIQAIYPFPDKAAVVCNEEGKNLGLPFNRPLLDENDLPYDIICGTFFVAGLGVEDFVSLTEEQIRRYKEHYDMPSAKLSQSPWISIPTAVVSMGTMYWRRRCGRCLN